MPQYHSSAPMFAPGSGAMSAHEEWSALDLAARCEKALALQHLVALCSTSGALAIRGLDSPCCVPAAPPPRRKAWVTLLTNAPYARGAVALAHSLSEAESQFPLIVLVTDGVPEVAPLVHTKPGCLWWSALVSRPGLPLHDVLPCPSPTLEGDVARRRAAGLSRLH